MMLAPAAVRAAAAFPNSRQPPRPPWRMPIPSIALEALRGPPNCLWDGGAGLAKGPHRTPRPVRFLATSRPATPTCTWPLLSNQRPPRRAGRLALRELDSKGGGGGRLHGTSIDAVDSWRGVGGSISKCAACGHAAKGEGEGQDERRRGASRSNNHARAVQLPAAAGAGPGRPGEGPFDRTGPTNAHTERRIDRPCCTTRQLASRAKGKGSEIARDDALGALRNNGGARARVISVVRSGLGHQRMMEEAPEIERGRERWALGHWSIRGRGAWFVCGSRANRRGAWSIDRGLGLRCSPATNALLPPRHRHTTNDNNTGLDTAQPGVLTHIRAVSID